MTYRLAGTIAVCFLAIGAAACGGSDDEAGTAEQGRTVETANGPVEVPDEPERVVVLDTGELDDTLALGVTPVGAVTTDVDSEFLGYLGDRTAGIESVGTITEPNLEQIAALDPDLILSSKVRHDALYDQLSDIAPTVFTETVGHTWKQNFRTHAEALGLEEKGDELMSAYDDKAAMVDEALPDGAVISLVRFVPDQTRLYSDKSFSGVITTDVGAQVPAAAKGADTFIELSPEKLGLAEADYILTSTYGAAEDTEQAAITESGLWTNLQAIKDGRTVQIDDDLITGIGIIAADQLLDEMQQAFAGTA